MSKGSKMVFSNEMVWVLDPNDRMAGPVASNGRIIAYTSPGCWGPMITPDYPSGHEVTRPVYVEGAEVGDAVVIRISKINIRSLATTSGVDKLDPQHFGSDPFVDKKCPGCGRVNPETYVEGHGPDAIKCKNCGTPVHPFEIENGYTMLMDKCREFGITVDEETAETIAGQAAEFGALPPNSSQYSANILARSDFEPVPLRIKPMVGNIGSCPAVRLPSSHNAGDFGASLINAANEFGLTEEELEKRTDGHMDCNSVREGSIVIVPVKVPGAGIYVGDVHAMMGNGEIAGHTTDISAEVVMDIGLIKGLRINSPIVLPLWEDLPWIALPYDAYEVEHFVKLAKRYDIDLDTDYLPMQFIGTGEDLNKAARNAIKDIAEFLNMPVGEVKNRATIMGSVDIGRLPGVIKVSMLVPGKRLREIDLGLYRIAYDMYRELIEE